MLLTHVPARLYLDYSECHVLRNTFTDQSVQRRDQNEERVRKQERLRGQGGEDDLRAFLSERKLPYLAEPQKAALKGEELESWILGMEEHSDNYSCQEYSELPHQARSISLLVPLKQSLEEHLRRLFIQSLTYSTEYLSAYYVLSSCSRNL